MMLFKKFGLLYIGLLLSFQFVASAAAVDITTLLKSVEKQPQALIDTLAIEQGKAAVKKAYSPLFPKVYAIGSYEHYNSPTNLRPLPPTEVNIAAGESIPFSENIYRYGVQASVPIFIKEVFDTAKSLKAVAEKSQIKRDFTIIANQSAVLSLNSTLIYLSDLQRLIKQRISSLRETEKIVEMGVRNGRLAEFELFKIQKLMQTLDLQLNDVSTRKNTALRKLMEITGMSDLQGPVPMELVRELPTKGAYMELALLKRDIEAAGHELKAKKDYLFPKLYLQGFYTGNIGEAYNTGDRIDRSYAKVAINLTFPLFDRTSHEDEQIARIKLKKAKAQYKKLRQELDAKAGEIRRQAPIIRYAIEKAKKNIDISRQILEISKVAYQNRRMTIEDYLQYEVDVLEAETRLSFWKDQQWRLVAQQAVLFGQNLIGVVQ
ncbi:MAG: hypothetical protein DRH15_10085 [Deltaproteobacteria bacterium]|nr:MAG: hypothetical protein DRH15_10085 [Deltaproteobacteria bacterium]